MKKLSFLIAAIALVLNAHAQLNKKWSHTQSLSGGAFPSHPVSFHYHKDVMGEWIYTTSNETINATGDSIQGYISKYDSAGNLQWNVALSPAVKISDSPAELWGLGGYPYNTGDEWPMGGILGYNTTTTTSHLIAVDTSGGIQWDIITAGINRIIATVTDSAGNTVLAGRTAVAQCGAYLCNGIAIAKYNATGGLVWKKTKYTSGNRTKPMSIVTDTAGNVIVCGKKATVSAPAGTYDKTFVLKYSPAGTLLFEKQFTEVSDESSAQKLSAAYGYYFSNEIINGANHHIKLRKLDGVTGAVQWTKTITNAELFPWAGGTSILVPTTVPWFVISTSTGMKAYDDAGALQWSNTLVTSAWPDDWSIGWLVAKNVNPAQPLNNYLVQLDTATGAILFQKNLSNGNHEEYFGEYDGILIGEVTGNLYLLINDTVPPYGTRLTKLSPCADFTYNFNAAAAVTNVNNASCNNGKITVNSSGSFNSWPHMELWKGNSSIVQWDSVGAVVSHAFTNLAPGTYTIKTFDESCGEQDTTVTIKCPAPSSGLTTTNILSTSAQANWNPPSCSNTFRIQYRTTGTTAWTTVSGISTPFYMMTGLQPGMGYQWKVATKCNSTGTAIYSNYSSIKSFATQSPRVENGYTEEAISTQSMEIIPNPVTNQFSVSLSSGIANGSLSIYNVHGQLVMNKNIPALSEEEVIHLDAASLPKGMYLVQVLAEGRVFRGRFIKQ